MKARPSFELLLLMALALGGCSQSQSPPPAAVPDAELATPAELRVELDSPHWITHFSGAV